MNKNETQLLIDRYLNGVTTPEDEKLLARALLGDDIPDEWKVVRIMLGELAMGEAEYDTDMAEDASRRKSFVLPLTAKWLIAASVALLFGFVCFNYVGHNEENVVAKVETRSVSGQKDNNAIDEKRTAIDKHTNERTTAVQKSDSNNLLADNIEKSTEKSLTEPIQSVAQHSEPMDENLHYASMTGNDSPNKYQPPSRMEEFIVKMAAYNRVKDESLACASNHDTLTVCKAYVFEDTKELNLFSRLLQAVCWYEDTTPGYLLNYSHQQFFFQLKDLRLGMQYLWIAERICGKILMYCTHSPLDTVVSSDCFREYRDKLSNTYINPNTKKL